MFTNFTDTRMYSVCFNKDLLYVSLCVCVCVCVYVKSSKQNAWSQLITITN